MKYINDTICDYRGLNYTPISKVMIAPQQIIVVDKFKPFIWISFDFEDQWRANNDMFSNFLFETFAEAFAPNDYEKMKIKKISDERAKERTVTTHFKELISLS